MQQVSKPWPFLAVLFTKGAELSAANYFLFPLFTDWMEFTKIYMCMLAECADRWAKSSFYLGKIPTIFCFIISVVLLKSSWKSRKQFTALFLKAECQKNCENILCCHNWTHHFIHWENVVLGKSWEVQPYRWGANKSISKMCPSVFPGDILVTISEIRKCHFNQLPRAIKGMRW